MSLFIPKYIQGIPNQQVLTALFDSGGTISLIHSRVISTEVIPTIGDSQIFTTLAGEFHSNQQVLLQEIVLPEFKRTAYIDKQTCQVFTGPCTYDVILGRDFLRKLHFHINFDDNTMNCMDMSVPMRSPDFFTNHTRLHDIMFFDDVEVDSFASLIKQSKYKSISISDVINTQLHLSSNQRTILSTMLAKHVTLFDGILKVYPHRLIHLDIIPNAVPRHLRAYPVAHIHLDVFKAELLRLCDIGVLEVCGALQWASPTFIIPKKDGTVCWVSDFGELNKVIQQHIYPLPHLQDILKCHPGYSYFSKLDVSMQYFTFPLDKDNQNLCVISTPFGLYKYKRLPMGIKQSSDIAKEVMENLFRDLDDCLIPIGRRLYL